MATMVLIITSASSRALLGALLLLALQAALILIFLEVFDAPRLVRRGFRWHSMLARFHDGFIEAFVAALGVVVLFSTVVGLDYHGIGAHSHIAGPLELAMNGSGDMLQQRVQGYLQSSFRIDSL